MAKKKERIDNMAVEVEKLSIPEDEIWTYRIEGLQPPKIEKRKITAKYKVFIVAILLVAISLSIYFSIRAVSNDEFKYSETETGIELVKYSNVDESLEVTIDYMNGDKSKPITELHEYAFNCDEKIKTVNLGKDIQKIDGKSFYSCWSLENVFVDDENPYYCDIDGVLYTKDLSQIIYYPSSHNIALARNAGYKVDFPEDGSVTNDDFTYAASLLNGCVINGTDPASLEGGDAEYLEKLTKLTGVTDYTAFIKDYNAKIGYYVLPSSVTKIGKLAFAYSDVFAVYIPEGVTEMETMAFFKAEKLREIYSYKSDSVIADTDYSAVGSSLNAYRSLPEGLKSIGSDCFSYNRLFSYMFIPSSVTEIGHHAFYGMCSKDGDVISGVAVMNVADSEEKFKADTDTGESWLPQYNSGLFKKSIDVNYSAVREK